MRWLAVVVVATAAGCSGASQATRKNVDLVRAMPAELNPGTKHEGDVKVARVRVFADADFRAHEPHWKQDVTDEIDYANQLLTPMLGVRLEITDVVEWDHSAPDAPLRETLAALAAAAPDDDRHAHWVIGFTAPPSSPTSAFDELGTAELFGRTIVVRAMSSDDERAAFAKQFPDIALTDAGDALDARRRHHATCLLLHQLGHTLGAIHETDPSWIMHATYDPQQATIAVRNRELMQVALDDRLQIAELRDKNATAAKMLAAIDKDDWGGWIAGEKDDEEATLRAIVDAAKQGAVAPDVPAAVYDQYVHAQKLSQEGRPVDALAALEPLIAAYPGNAQIRLLACKVRLAPHGPPTQEAKDVCARAAELAQGDPGPYLAMAGAYAQVPDHAGARAQLALAAARVPNVKDNRAGVWTQVALQYQELGDLTHAEDAAAAAQGAAAPDQVTRGAAAGAGESQITAWAKRTRARYGDPRDGARWHVTPDNEAEYVDAVKAILDLVYASKYDEAAAAANAADKRWPRSPGVASARCDLAIRLKQTGVAIAQCKAAIAAFPGDSWALYLDGILALAHADPRPGITRLKAAIAADPELAQAWRALAQALARAHDDDDLRRLRADYQAAFGTALP